MSNWMRIVIVGFIAGALSVLIFHQFGFWLATELGFGRSRIYNMQPVPPWGVPTIVSLAFWGGLWGILAAFLVPRLPGALAGVLGWILFAAIVVTLVNWFVVLPIKGQPTGGGFFGRANLSQLATRMRGESLARKPIRPFRIGGKSRPPRHVDQAVIGQRSR